MILVDSIFMDLCPDTRLWIINGMVDNSLTGITSTLVDETVDNSTFYDSRIEPILHARSAYNACGKEPGRYRPSAEALRRRIKSGKGLYKISPVVDIINVISIKSGISIGGYDFETLKLPISLKVGGKDPYEAVGRGMLNIEFLPCLYDDIGPFGSPTSDSTRSMIGKGTSRLLMVFYDFGAYDKAEEFVDEAKLLLEKYCNFSPQYVGLL